MPATRATASTSPLVIAPEAIIDAVSAFIETRQRATARRWVASLGVTSTMRARPRGSRWVRPTSLMALRLVSGGAPPEGGSAADLAHRLRRPDELDLVDLVPGPLGGDVAGDGGGQLVVGAAAPQQAAQIHLVEGEEAVAQAALGGEADPVAGTAEGVGDAGDHADLAPPVHVAMALGGVVVPADGLEGVHGADRGHDLVPAHDLVGRP